MQKLTYIGARGLLVINYTIANTKVGEKIDGR